MFRVEQKPKAICDAILELFTKGPVLDLFCGPGMFGRCAVEKGLGYLGVDNDPEVISFGKGKMKESLDVHRALNRVQQATLDRREGAANPFEDPPADDLQASEHDEDGDDDGDGDGDGARAAAGPGDGAAARAAGDGPRPGDGAAAAAAGDGARSLSPVRLFQRRKLKVGVRGRNIILL